MNKKRKKRREKLKKTNFIYDNFLISLKYLWEIRNYLVAVAVLFVFFSLVGFVYHPPFLQDKIMGIIQEMIKNTENLGPLELTGFIMMNNIQTSFTGMFFGIFLGVIPVLVLMLNAYVIGFVAYLAVASQGILSLWRLIPHGIFELSAVFISVAIGVKLGALFLSIKNKRKGFLAGLLSFFVFVFALSISFAIISSVFLISSGVDFNNKESLEKVYEDISNSPSLSFISPILSVVCLFFGIFIGVMILDKKDKKFIVEGVKNAFRVFLLIVIPLLVIAGIIEGSLIYLVNDCDSLENIDHRNQCYYETALQKHKVWLCEEIDDNQLLRDYCYKDFAEESGREELCEKIIDSELRESCN